jgi:hypothetical protein
MTGDASVPGATINLKDERPASSHITPVLVVCPLCRPLVIAGPFGTGKRVLLQRLFESLPGRFAAPVVTTTKETSHPEVDDRWDKSLYALRTIPACEQ